MYQYGNLGGRYYAYAIYFYHRSSKPSSQVYVTACIYFPFYINDEWYNRYNLTGRISPDCCRLS